VSLQLLLTHTEYRPFNLPFRGCSRYPGMYMSSNDRAVSIAANCSRNPDAWRACIPDREPISKNRLSPLWRIDLITRQVYSVAHQQIPITEYNLPSQANRRWHISGGSPMSGDRRFGRSSEFGFDFPLRFFVLLPPVRKPTSSGSACVRLQNVGDHLFNPINPMQACS
jgi:hypothetical protein